MRLVVRLLLLNPQCNHHLHNRVSRVEENLTAGSKQELVDQHFLDNTGHTRGSHHSVEGIIPEMGDEAVTEVHTLRITLP